jgi:hypothetical protein
MRSLSRRSGASREGGPILPPSRETCNPSRRACTHVLQSQTFVLGVASVFVRVGAWCRSCTAASDACQTYRVHSAKPHRSKSTLHRFDIQCAPPPGLAQRRVEHAYGAQSSMAAAGCHALRRCACGSSIRTLSENRLGSCLRDTTLWLTGWRITSASGCREQPGARSINACLCMGRRVRGFPCRTTCTSSNSSEVMSGVWDPSYILPSHRNRPV